MGAAASLPHLELLQEGYALVLKGDYRRVSSRARSAVRAISSHRWRDSSRAYSTPSSST